MKESEAEGLSELLARTTWVRAVARAIVKDVHRADDLAQDAWVRALEGGPRRAESWQGWFATVMRNRANEERRASARRVLRDGAHESASAHLTPLEVQQRMELHQALGAAVCRLAEPYRSTVIRHYFEGWSLRKIAAAEGCGVRAVETRLRRARAMLRDELEKRAPAEHWAAGLLLFAATQSVLPLVAAAAVLVAVGLSVPILLMDGAGADDELAEPTATAALPPLAPRSPEGEVAATTIEPVSREEIAGSREQAPFELVILTFEREGREIVGVVPEVKVSARTLDGLGGEVESAEGVTDGAGRLTLRLARPAEGVVLEATPRGRTHYGTLRVNAGVGAIRPNGRAELPLHFEALHGSVSGAVLDEERRPVPFAFVDIWNDESWLIERAPDGYVQSDAHGRFEVAPARTKRDGLLLVPRAPDMAVTRAFELERNGDPHATWSGVELGLAPGRPFTVLVADERGQPVEGARVSVWPGEGDFNLEKGEGWKATGRRHFGLHTDRDGRTPVMMIDRQVWQVGVQHPAYRVEPAQFAEPGELMLVTVHAGRHVRGRVLTEEGRRAFANAAIVVESASGREVGRSGVDGNFVVRAPGESGEEVRVVVLPTNKLAFYVTNPFVPERLEAPLEFSLAAGISLVAELVYSDGRPYDRITGITYEVLGGPRARRPGGRENETQSWLDVRIAAEDARMQRGGMSAHRFFMHSAPPGEYRIRFSDADGLLGETTLTPARPKAQVIVDAEPSPDASVFAGNVRHAATGRPIAAFQVVGWRYVFGDSQPFPEPMVDRRMESADGAFRCETLEVGWWEFRIRAGDGMTEWSSGRVATHELGVHRRIELDDAAGGELRLLHPDGKPAAHCKLRVVDAGGEPLLFRLTPDGSSVREASTDGEGRISLHGLPRHAPFQLDVTPGRAAHRLPLGALDLTRSVWEFTLPE
jgi:RNA polymerase sigma factor (sigma-70 family)